MTFRNDLEFAKQRDASDSLRRFRERFIFPTDNEGKPKKYFAGNSLGLQPKATESSVLEELTSWKKFAVDGHFKGKNPWYPYHERVSRSLAKVVGAKEMEVVAMNTLTTNLHLMMVSFYRPNPKRFKICYLEAAFPSDRYAIRSQIEFHGYDPSIALLPLRPRDGESVVREEDVLEVIEREGDSIALVLLENVNYLTGQALPMKSLTEASQKKGCKVGWDLAHGVGNLPLQLHDDGPDFAVWCSYKYLNGGPGCIAGCFVHDRWADKAIPRFAGWWGQDKASRFMMGSEFHPISGAEGWQLSNPSILSLAALRASLDCFDEATIEALAAKGQDISGYLIFLLENELGEKCEVLTPREPDRRGAQVSVRLKGADKSWVEQLNDLGIVGDFRQPDVFRFAPVPLYCSYQDVFELVQGLKSLCS